VAPEPPSVEIVPLSELDPSSTALEPELASELARRADEVILDAATCEASIADPADPADAAGISVRTFPPVASSAAAARNLAVQELADIPADVVEDIRLMVSELASNAIEHAVSSFRLTISRSRQEIRVEVTDGGGGTPAMRSPGPDALKGHGLQIVNALATRWGVERESDSAKTVWFTVEFGRAAGPKPPA
jgi:anti-sigma regulatory factor (Ser/Thr protein kinase)